MALVVWDVQSGQNLRIIGGYTTSLEDIAWSPNGTQLASCGANALVMIWAGAKMASPFVLRAAHRWTIQGVAWSPDGSLLYVQGTHAHPWCGRWLLTFVYTCDKTPILFMGIAWSPDGTPWHVGIYSERSAGVEYENAHISLGWAVTSDVHPAGGMGCPLGLSWLVEAMTALCMYGIAGMAHCSSI